MIGCQLQCRITYVFRFCAKISYLYTKNVLPLRMFKAVEPFKPPNRSNLTLEPDLAYAGTTRRNRNVVARVEARNMVCWRCRATGHGVRDCPKKKNDFRCFSCGREGFTKATCPTCNPKSRFVKNRLLSRLKVEISLPLTQRETSWRRSTRRPSGRFCRKSKFQA